MKRLFKIGISIYFVFSIILLGQITTFADEVKPMFEYNFDNDSGTTVIDSGSKRQNGTAKGTEISKLITGYDGTGYARHFEKAKKQFIKFGPLSINHDARSIRLKVRSNGIPASVQSECILSTTNTKDELCSFVRINGDKCPNPEDAGKIQFAILLNAAGCKSPVSICDGKWHDILYTFDLKTQKLYIDDMENPVVTIDGDYYPRSSYTENRITLGSYSQDSNNGGFFEGDLDNIQIYSTAIIPESSIPVTSPNLTALSGDTKIDLTWDAVNKATGYTVKRATTAGGPYTTIASDLTETSYTDTNVTNGTTYYYIVSAVNNGKEVTNSNEVSAAPNAATTPPATEAKLKVVLEVSEALRLSVDDNLNINTQMVWSSSVETVATVNEKGVVTAVAPGNTVITVKSVDGSYTDYINVLVVENADDYRLAIDLKVGDTARLTADDFTNTANVTWAPMDSSIANVTSKGKVTALSKGLVLITAKDNEGNIIGRVYVRVRE